VDVVELARRRQAAAERRALALRAEAEAAEREAARWAQLIRDAEALLDQMVVVKKGSLACRAAQALTDKGPLSMRDIHAELCAAGPVPLNHLNYTLWRRKDLFEKQGSLYHLRTTAYQVMDWRKPKAKEG
jgi:hypothetical protein